MNENIKTPWIWLPDFINDENESASVVLFRRTLEISEKELKGLSPNDSKIEVSADSKYRLYVNGQLINYGPARGDSQIWYYDTYDLISYLHAGNNVIAAEVLYYSPTHPFTNYGMFHSKTPGFYLKANGKLEYLTADETWKCIQKTDFHIFRESLWFSPLMLMEDNKNHSELTGWINYEYDDSFWKNAYVYPVQVMNKSSSPANLFERPIPFMYLKNIDFRLEEKTGQNRTEINLPFTAPANTKVQLIISCKVLETAFIDWTFENGINSEIKFTYTEGYYKKNGDSWKKYVRDDESGEITGFYDRITLTGSRNGDRPLNSISTQKYSPFWWRTFRFIKVEIETKDQPLIIKKVTLQETGYPLKVNNVPQKALNDPVKKQIWDISLRTLQRCTQETYTDCPYYEQLQYAMDSRSQILFTYKVSGDDRLARNCMEDFKRSQRSDGLINAAYPSMSPNVIPGFSIFYILMIKDHIDFFGDKTFARKFTGSVDAVLNFFNEHLDKNGLVSKVGGPNYADRRYWSFVDWTKQWDKTTGVPPATFSGGITMESLLYLYGLQAAVNIMDFLGFYDLAEEYKKRAQILKENINKYCRGKSGMYLDGPAYSATEAYSQHTQVFAILTDCCSTQKGKEILEPTLKDSGNYAQCSVAMAFYLFRALEKTGLYDYTKDKWKLWEKMLDNHLTTCVEDDVRERSDCHAWGALALYEYFLEDSGN